MNNTNNDVCLGVLLPTGQAQWGEGADPRRLIDFAVSAERLGYASVWVNDSVINPRIEPLTMLAAAAAVTERVTLGTATLLPVLRRPVLAAQALASLDLLSGGRLVVAVGAGFPGRFGRPLHTLSEVPWPRRFARLDDTVALWRQLRGIQGQGPSAFHGEYGAGLADVRQAARDARRPTEAITPALFVTVLIAADVDSGRHALDEYSRLNYGLPLEVLGTIQLLITGSAAHVAAELDRYIAAGARHIVCRIGVLGFESQLDQAEQIVGIPLAAAKATHPGNDTRRP